VCPQARVASFWASYRPLRAALSLALLLAIGSIVFEASPPAPLKPAEAPHFNPVIYTLDLLLPIVDLHQESAFNPAGADQWFSYLLVAAGWILATTIATGVARIISRRLQNQPQHEPVAPTLQPPVPHQSRA
jgi:hypothetical protein